MENIKWFDLRNSNEDKAERERFEQAYKLISETIIFDALHIPGAYIKRYGHKYSRLSELKDYHFNHYYRKY